MFVQIEDKLYNTDHIKFVDADGLLARLHFQDGQAFKLKELTKQAVFDMLQPERVRTESMQATYAAQKEAQASNEPTAEALKEALCNLLNEVAAVPDPVETLVDAITEADALLGGTDAEAVEGSS